MLSTFHLEDLGKSVLDSHPYTVQCKVLQPMKTYTSHFTDVAAIHLCNSKKCFSKVLLPFFFFFCLSKEEVSLLQSVEVIPIKYGPADVFLWNLFWKRLHNSGCFSLKRALKCHFIRNLRCWS